MHDDMNGSFMFSCDSKVILLGPGVDNKFSHGSCTSIECVKMTKLLQLHSPMFTVQVCSLYCALYIQIKQRTVRRSKGFGEFHFLNFAPCISPRD